MPGLPKPAVCKDVSAVQSAHLKQKQSDFACLIDCLTD